MSTFSQRLHLLVMESRVSYSIVRGLHRNGFQNMSKIKKGHGRGAEISSPKLKGKSHSSQQWITRHINDPFVKQARAANYRARSAFKLLEMDTKHHILAPGHVVIDCGAAPGSWTQVAVERTNSAQLDKTKPFGTVIAVDLLRMENVDGATVLEERDFTDKETQELIKTHLGGRLADAVISDMAPNATGMSSLDHEQIVALVQEAMGFASDILKKNGKFLAKLWDGHETGMLKRDLAGRFSSVKILRPEASRKESAELFLLAQGFKQHLVHPGR